MIDRLVYAFAFSAAGAFLIVFSLPGSVAVWACTLPAIGATSVAAARVSPAQQRLTAFWCSVPPAAAMGAAYWDDLSKENGYVPLQGLVVICLIVFAVTFCSILACLRFVAWVRR